MSTTKALPVLNQADILATRAFLSKCLSNSITEQSIAWLEQKSTLLSSEAAHPKDLYLAFSAVPRFISKNTIKLTQKEIDEANRLRQGFNPANWSTTQMARTILLLSIPHQDQNTFIATIETLFNTADMGELVSLYASLALLPYPDRFKKRAAEGIRTNMGDVFEAIALNNPYPADYMEEDAWNQMVLKTLFVGKPIYLIYGIEQRANPKLARMLSDYAHERWAAGRKVSPELWRSVGPYLDDNLIHDIERLFQETDELEQEAAALACMQSNYPPSLTLLDKHIMLKERISNGEITWDNIGNRYNSLN